MELPAKLDTIACRLADFARKIHMYSLNQDNVTDERLRLLSAVSQHTQRASQKEDCTLVNSVPECGVEAMW